MSVTDKQTTPANLVLWFRLARGHRWEPVATAATSQALTAKIAEARRSGEWLTLPSGQHPDDFGKRRSA